MRITYLKNGKKYSTRYSNKDLIIETKVINHRTTVKVIALEDITLVEATEWVPFNVNFHDHYFLNGYQSWTDTNEYKLAKRLRNVKKSPHIITKSFALDKYGDSTFYKYSIKKSHGYDVFYSKGREECFIYSLNYECAYLIIELIKDRSDIHLISDINNWKLFRGDEATVFDYYLCYNYEQGLASFHNAYPKREIEKVFGYTSWYNYYQNINEEIILRDLDALDNRFNVFQIDDGYETFVGDWLDVDPAKFPNGLKPIVDKIHSRGYKAGLWLAPFVAESKSKVFKEHKNWFKKTKKGTFVKAGANWSGFYSLDLDNKDAVNYIKKCLTHYMDMGFDFFKLDFLYAVGLDNYDGRTRCMVQGDAYKLLHDTLKDKLILGCGANIINSYLNFDYLRIGPDVSLKFDDIPLMRLFHRERISTKVTLKNTIFRSIFNGHLFGNDPDVFLLRDDNIELSVKQRRALTIINALFGSVLMTSDDIATYDEQKKATLKEALDIFQHAEVTFYETQGKKVAIRYQLNGIEHSFKYNTTKGVLEDER